MVGAFCHTSFLTMIWCPETPPGNVFSPTITHTKIFEKIKKKYFFEVLTFFSNLTHFYVYFLY